MEQSRHLFVYGYDTDYRSKFLHGLEKEYLSFAIASKILDRPMEIDEEILNARLSKLIYLINKNRNYGHPEIKKVADLYNKIKISRDFYYENYINGVVDSVSTNDISVPFLQIKMFVSAYTRNLGRDFKN